MQQEKFSMFEGKLIGNIYDKKRDAEIKEENGKQQDVK
jgi:hypothetical protein